MTKDTDLMDVLELARIELAEIKKQRSLTTKELLKLKDSLEAVRTAIINEQSTCEASIRVRKKELEDYIKNEKNELNRAKEDYNKRLHNRLDDVHHKERVVADKELEVEKQLESLSEKSSEFSAKLVELNDKIAFNEDLDKGFSRREDMARKIEQDLDKMKDRLNKKEANLFAFQNTLDKSLVDMEKREHRCLEAEKDLSNKSEDLKSLKKELVAREGDILAVEEGSKATEQVLNIRESDIQGKEAKLRSLERKLTQEKDSLRGFDEDLKIREVRVKRQQAIYKMKQEGVEVVDSE